MMRLRSAAFRPLTFLPAATVWALMIQIGCVSSAVVHPNIEGHVLDDGDKPIAGVKISLAQAKQSAVTDALGHYAIAYDGKLGDHDTLTASEAKHAGRSLPIVLANVTTMQNITLRPVDISQPIVLPTGSQAPVVVGVSKAGSDANLIVYADSLVTTDGTLATGAAEVHFTFWAPGTDMTSAPGPLVARAHVSDASLNGLLSFGMADIQITQGNQTLQVAASKTLGLTISQPQSYAQAAQALAERGGNVPSGAPALWYLDPNQGIWVLGGSLSDGSMTFDGNTFTGQLAHLSGWNVDAIWQPNACVQGVVTDTCGAPVANSQLSLWLIGGGSIIEEAIATDDAGNFCKTTQGSANQAVDGGVASAYYFVSRQHQPAQTSCNPTGSETFAQLCSWNNWSCVGSEDDPVNFSAGINKCKTPQATLALCHYCPSDAPITQCQARNSDGSIANLGAGTKGGCTTLPLAPLPDLAGKCGTVDPCSKSTAKHLGDSCNAGDVCCPTSTLICADHLCLPKADP